MAHMPLAFHGHASSIAVICFGMGTTYRSALDWNVRHDRRRSRAERAEAFPYYFDDAPALMKHPKGRIVIDDGRRFLHQHRETIRRHHYRSAAAARGRGFEPALFD